MANLWNYCATYSASFPWASLQAPEPRSSSQNLHSYNSKQDAVRLSQSPLVPARVFIPRLIGTPFERFMTINGSSWWSIISEKAVSASNHWTLELTLGTTTHGRTRLILPTAIYFRGAVLFCFICVIRVMQRTDRLRRPLWIKGQSANTGTLRNASHLKVAYEVHSEASQLRVTFQ